MLIDVLAKIACEFNDKNIKWAVGSSIVMNYFGLIEKMNDIDLIISKEDVVRADNILKYLGTMKPLEIESGIYTTEVFHEYIVDNIEVDMMSGLGIKHDKGIYNYIIDNDTYLESFRLKDEIIYYSSLEDWYVLYQLIGNRENKVSIIEKYFLEKGFDRNKLEGIALECLPNNINLRIKELLKK